MHTSEYVTSLIPFHSVISLSSVSTWLFSIQLSYHINCYSTQILIFKERLHLTSWYAICLCPGWYFVNLTQSDVIWAEGNLFEKMPTPAWPVGHFLG